MTICASCIFFKDAINSLKALLCNVVFCLIVIGLYFIVVYDKKFPHFALKVIQFIKTYVQIRKLGKNAKKSPIH